MCDILRHVGGWGGWATASRGSQIFGTWDLQLPRSKKWFGTWEPDMLQNVVNNCIWGGGDDDDDDDDDVVVIYCIWPMIFDL